MTSTAYDLTVGTIVNMDTAIYMLSPQDTPLLTGLGGDGAVLLASEPVDQIVFDWMDDTILTPRSSLAGALTTTQNFLTVAAGDRNKFSTGDILAIAKPGNTTETLRVTGYAGTDALSVTRQWAGTATPYVTSSIVMGLGTALAEGSDPEAARVVDRSLVSNVTQIFGPTQVDMSRTAQQVAKYGVANEFNHQLQKRIKENAIGREQAFVYGRMMNSTGAKIRTTGGLVDFVRTNRPQYVSLTVTTLQAAQLTGYNAGGFADVVMANPVAFTDLNALADTSIVRDTIDDPMRGRVRVAWVETEFGSVMMVRNRWMAPNDAVGFTRAQVRRRVMQPLIFERLAKTGDSDQGQIVCEEGLQVKGQTHMFWFNSLGYSGSI